MAETDDQSDNGDAWPYRSFKPTQSRVTELEVSRQRRGREGDMPPQNDGQRTPDQQSRHHDGGDLHDTQCLAAGFVNALDVLPPEIEGDADREEGSKVVHVEGERLT